MDKWDVRFLELAKHVAAWSKDPSTRTGAAVVDEKRRVVSLGYNGFPRGVADTGERLDDRNVKYKMVVHAEANAVLFAARPLAGCSLYSWPFQPCSACAALIIQTGVSRCVAPLMPERLADRWREDCAVAAGMLCEAGVALDVVSWR